MHFRFQTTKTNKLIYRFFTVTIQLNQISQQVTADYELKSEDLVESQRETELYDQIESGIVHAEEIQPSVPYFSIIFYNLIP